MTSARRRTAAGLGVGLVIAAAVVLPAGPAAAAVRAPAAVAVAADARPATGATIVRRGAAGSGVLRVDNGTGDDAVVTLARGARAVRAVYVRGHDAATVRGVADGTYDLYVAFGSGWSAGSQRFATAARYARFDRTARFTTRRVGGGTAYTRYRVTLQPVAGGAARLLEVPAAAFPR
jgi:hypothetical protein